jgi:putative hemolysin
MTTQILIVFILIALNGFFALSEMSVVTSRKPRLKQMSGESRRAKAALDLAEQPERFLSTVQVGITLIGILTGVFGGSAIGAQIATWLTPLKLDPEVAEGIGMAVSVVLIGFFTIVFGELVPKRIALLAPERIATNVAMPMRILGIVAMPFVWLLSHSTRLLLKLLQLDRGNQSKVSEEEIRMLVAEGHEQGLIDDDERAMMNRVMRLGDRTAESLMTPRNRIAWLDTRATREENLEVLGEHPYSRYPVYRGSDSDVAGILEAKSLARLFAKGAQQFDLFAELKPPLFVAESTKAIALLEIFRDESAHLALVVDEYGDLQGLVTLNDLLGAVLGQALSQELDTGPSDSPVIRRADGSYLVDGSLSAEDLRELMELSELPGEEEHDYNTAAGMVIAHFSRIPAPGETFEFGHWRIEVVDLDGARIDKLLICRVEDDGTEDITA